ncbi:MAG: HlyD family efflux transporter periplasmic adaptor subunit [Puia sp.]
MINPVAGVVLSKYAMAGEVAMIGKPLYKISNMDTLTLKAYVTGDQLRKLRPVSRWPSVLILPMADIKIIPESFR